PEEFLRYVVYKATGETLLIKSKSLIEKIKSNMNIEVSGLFKQADLNRLAEIFYRYKPIFLALRHHMPIRSIINKIPRLAKENHRPAKEDYLNTVTSKIKNGVEIDTDELHAELERVNIFRKIRLAYALKFRTTDCNSALYRVRNGRSWAEEFKW